MSEEITYREWRFRDFTLCESLVDDFPDVERAVYFKLRGSEDDLLPLYDDEEEERLRQALNQMKEDPLKRL